MNKEQLHRLKSLEIFKVVQFLLAPKNIHGALKSAIHAHGPIPVSCPECGHMGLFGLTNNELLVLSKDKEGNWIVAPVAVCGAASASKRIRGALKTRLEEWLSTYPDLLEEDQV